jgi:hypothetical protein
MTGVEFGDTAGAVLQAARRIVAINNRVRIISTINPLDYNGFNAGVEVHHSTMLRDGRRIMKLAVK